MFFDYCWKSLGYPALRIGAGYRFIICILNIVFEKGNKVQKNKRGLSLAEVLIAMVILAIAASGIFASFIAANKFVSRSKRRLSAVNLVRFIGDDLYRFVSADTWNDLTTNLLSCSVAGVDPDNTDYPCDKSTDAVDFDQALFDYLETLVKPNLDADNPMDNYVSSVVVRLRIDLDSPVDPKHSDCHTNCPRIVDVGIEWNE